MDFGYDPQQLHIAERRPDRRLLLEIDQPGAQLRCQERGLFDATGQREDGERNALTLRVGRLGPVGGQGLVPEGDRTDPTRL